ncbi:ATP-binding protein [Streptomyces sp. NPDC018031]|uniref:ATP-binding protein n=1 Tax=Streptomyces sp. NPDC018031 TaxID=3365033 RepID=UPI003788CB9E
MATTGSQRVGDTLPRSAADARDTVSRLLRDQLRPVPDTAITDALLVTSELVTNAIRHAGGVTGYHTAVLDGRVVITVEDAEDALPRLTRDSAAPLPGGHGWPMVCHLACQVQVVPLPGGGKRITAAVVLH